MEKGNNKKIITYTAVIFWLLTLVASNSEKGFVFNVEFIIRSFFYLLPMAIIGVGIGYIVEKKFFKGNVASIYITASIFNILFLIGSLASK